MTLLFDEDRCISCSPTSESTSQKDLKKIGKLKEELSVTQDMARKIKLDTKGQRNNPKWF